MMPKPSAAAAWLDHALAYAALGFPVVPIHYLSESGACSCGDPACKSPGKHPLTKNGLHDATTDPAIIKRWAMAWPNANIAWVLGDHHMVVDIDPRNGGDESLIAIEDEFGAFPDTLRAKTGGGGSHIVMASPGPVRNQHGKIKPGVDIKGKGGYIVVEPSRTAAGYEWLDWEPLSGEVPEIAPCPEWLIRLLTPKQRPQMHVVQGAKIVDGARNATLAKLAGSMRRTGFDNAAIEAALLSHNTQHCSPPLDDAEVRTIAKSISRYAPAESAVAAPSDAPWEGLLDRKKDGSLKANLNNASVLLSAPVAIQGVLAFNQFSLCIEAIREVPWREAGVWRETDAAQASIWLSREFGVDIGTDRIMEAVSVVAGNAPFHPIRSEILAAQWDKTPRLDFWLEDAFGVDRTAYHQAIGRKFLISMVARIFKPGCKCDTMLVLEGEQGQQKSTAIEALCGAEYFSTMTVAPDNKDFLVGMRDSWLIELAELDSFKRAQETTIKAMLSIHTDSYRAPYARTVQKYPRQCLFVGSTNKFAWNEDETGGRRFWPLRVVDVNVPAIRTMRLQLLAEAYEAFKNGEDWWKVPEAETLQQQSDRYMADSWEEVIGGWLDGKQDAQAYRGIDFAEGGGVARCTASQVMQLALAIPVERHSRAFQMRVSSVMRRLGWEKRRPEKEKPWIFMRPKS